MAQKIPTDHLVSILAKQFHLPMPEGNVLIALRGCGMSGGGFVKRAVDHIRLRCMLLVVQVVGGWSGKLLQAVSCTTAPSQRWLLNPMNRRGTPMIVPGLYRAHKKGQHKGHDAFKQWGPLNVIRNTDGNAKYNNNDTLSQEPESACINVHYGSTAMQVIGGWSAGCIAAALAWWSAQWQAILDLFEEGEWVPLVVVPYELVEAAYKDPGFHALMFGSRCELARKVQRRLKLKADGVFGYKTLEAVVAFQKENQIRADGVCGPMTFTAMGVEWKS